MRVKRKNKSIKFKRGRSGKGGRSEKGGKKNESYNTTRFVTQVAGNHVSYNTLLAPEKAHTQPNQKGGATPSALAYSALDISEVSQSIQNFGNAIDTFNNATQDGIQPSQDIMSAVKAQQDASNKIDAAAQSLYKAFVGDGGDTPGLYKALMGSNMTFIPSSG